MTNKAIQMQMKKRKNILTNLKKKNTVANAFALNRS